MSQTMRVFLFGDQTYDFVPGLEELLREHDNPILTAFLEQANFVIRAQMNKTLPPAERKASQASNIAQLLHKYREGVLNPAFQTALACIYQLGSFMSKYGEVGRPYPQPHETSVIGICTGALAAAAVSSCSSLSELLPAAVQTVQVAFRLGLCVVDVRDRIEQPTEDIPQSWSLVFSGLEPSKATSLIQEFCEETGLPKTSQPWIGATAAKATTISAPPSTLQRLLQFPGFSALQSKPITIYVPSHTSHLFSMDDVKKILETTLASSWSGYTSKIPIISSATGKIAWVGNFRGLLERALCECLLEPIRWDAVINEVPNIIRSKGAEKIAITPIATTAERSLASALKSLAEVTIDSSASSKQSIPGTIPAGKEKLAIIGMSGRFPEAQSPDAFWDLLYQGLDVVKKAPVRRWNVDTHVDASGKARNKGATPWGCWLDFAGEFDPRFFSISPKEAPQMDPAQRMALMSTYEAMEQAGMVPGTTAATQLDRVGVFHGVTSNDWMEVNASQDIDTYFITGGNRGFIPGRINFCFEFCGPSYTNDTACSSSLAAIHLACNSLWRGDCDTAVAGGTNMIFNPDGHAGLDKGFFLSRTGNCKTYDDKADGYCRAEGVGTIFIKRLSDAIADKDPILAVILDTKTNHSALSDSMTRPHVGAQIENMNAVLNNAGVSPNSFSYVEMHGTGTQVGDAVEMESVLSVFAPNESARDKEHPVWVGSAKANIGHGEGVSGVTSLAKVLLMMKHNIIPPHCGIKPGSKINHTFPDLGARNVHIAFKPTPWPRGDQPRRVLINNFSAAGGNTALILEDAPIREEITATDPRSSHVVAITGHVAASLKKNMQNLLDFITREEGNGLSLPQLSWTTTARRVQRIHRVAVVGSSLAEIKKGLQEAIERGDGTTRAASKPRILFAFTGQGSQYMGMASTLYDSFPTFHADIHRFDRLSRSLGFDSFVQVFESKDGDIEQFPPVVVQLAMCSMQMALANLLKSFGINPTVVVGHSLGEYAALNQAGVLSVTDTLFLVGKRAELLQSRCNRGTHAMLAIKASQAVLTDALVGKKYDVACINGPQDTVLSGTNDEIDSVRSIVNAKNFKSTKLQVPFAFHSAQVDPILESFIKIASSVTFRKPTIPVLCPLTGTVIDKIGIVTPSYLAQHCREAVNIEAALQFAKTSKLIDDKTFTIEIGPHPVVSGMVKATLGASMQTLPILQRNKDVWQNLATALSTLYRSSLNIDWVQYHASFEGCQKVLELPAYGWDLKDYYIEYRNDWCLYKGEGMPNSGALPSQGVPTTSVQKTIKPAEKPKSTVIPFPETTNVHRLVEDILEPLGATLIAETDISRPDTSHVAAGHSVNNIALTTPSFFADIAFILGKYLMNRLRPGYAGIVDVSDMVVDKALVPHGKGTQLLRTTLKVEWAAKAAGATKQAKCEFWSADETGKQTQKHAWCVVRFQDKTSLESLQARVPEFHAKIARLRQSNKSGEVLSYSGKAGYKLMSSIATFHPDYKLLDSVLLDEGTNEASSKLNFSTVKPGGTFAAHPASVDSITQLGGFVLNARDSTDLDKEVYVNHGWESFQVFEELKNDRTYDVYVQMAHYKADLYHGDTVVLDGSKVVAFFKGVSLRHVNRKALRMVLQQEVDKATRALNKKNGVSTGKAPAPVVKASPVSKTSPVEASKSPVKPRSTVVAPKPVVAPVAPKAQPPPPPAAAAPKPAADNAKVAQALEVIAEESGIAVSELTDESNFADIGVDSLLSMVIGSRFREELGLDLDADFSLFNDFPTIKDMKIFLGGSAGADPTPIPTITSAPQVVPAPVAPIQVVPVQAAPVQTAPVPAANSETVIQALEVIAEESGIAVSELTDESNFADIGVDSLLSMVIGSRFREELGLDLDADFSLFNDFPTIKDMKIFLGGSAEPVAENTSSAATLTTDWVEVPAIVEVAVAPPPKVVAAPIASAPVVQQASSAPVTNTAVTAALEIVSEESGIAMNDLSDDSNFADIGVDSLLSMVIGSRFREELGLDLDADFSLFADFPTIKDMKTFFSSTGSEDEDEEEYNDGVNSDEVTTPEDSGSESGSAKYQSDFCKPATSVILQGVPKVASKTIFLLPDGSGSASSYVTLPRLKGDYAIVGLNCPYARDPEDFDCSWKAMMNSFCTEIRRRQPKGPYYLGGWSSGGAFAFVCAQTLIAQGHEVGGLVIIDAPVPTIMEQLPTEFYEYSFSLGLFGPDEPPAHLIPHFRATVDVMMPYKPSPLKTNKMPKVGIIWATEVLMDEKDLPDLKSMHFMVHKRTEFGPDGWETVLPGAEFIMKRSEGCNHFTLIAKENAHRISELIQLVLA